MSKLKDNITSTLNAQIFEQFKIGYAHHRMIYNDEGEAIDYVFLEVNDVFLLLTGLQDVIGKSVKSLIPGIEDSWIKRYQLVIKSGKPENFDSYTEALKRKYQVMAFAGEDNTFFTLFIDVTKIEHLNIIAEKNDEKFRTLFNLSNDAIIYHDFDGNILEANNKACILLGYHQEEIKLMKITSFRADNNIEASKSNLERIKKEKKILIESVWKKKNGTDIPVEILASLADEDQNLVIANIRDLTERQKLSKELESTRVNIERVLEDQTEFLVRWKPEGTITFVNKAYIDYYRLPKEEVIGSNFYSWIPEESKIRLQNKISKITVENPVETDEHKDKNPDGQIVWHQWTDRGIFDKNGNLIEIQSTGRDVSDRVNAFEQLRVQHKYFEYLFEFSPYAIAILDLQDRILNANKRFTELFGYEVEEFHGVHINRLIVPDLLSIEGNEATRAVLNGNIIELETKRKTKDGRLLDVAIIGKPVIIDGEQKAVYGIYRDITKQKKAEDIIQKNATRLETLLSIAQAQHESIENLNKMAINAAIDITGSQDGIMVSICKATHKMQPIFVSTGAVDRYNKMSIIEIQSGIPIFHQLVHKNQPLILNYANQVEELSFAEALDGVKRMMCISFENSEECTNLICLFNKGTEYDSADIHQVQVLMEASFNIVARQKSTAELKLAKEKAEESDKLKSSFLATMSHELRTPLNAIIGFSNLIDDTYSVEEIIDFVKVINHSGNHLLGIINDMFYASVLESGEINLSLEEIDLHGFMIEMRDLVLGEISSSNKPHLSVEYIPDNKNQSIKLNTDPAKLNQVLIALFRNALKFTEEGGIKFGFKHKNDGVIEFFISDTGIGIPPEKQSIIFEKFRQVDDSSTRKYGGVGLGLSISKKLIQLMGGEIDFVSQQNKGTTFFIRFSSAKTEEITKIPEDPKSDNLWESICILIAEDEPSNYLLLESMLKPTGAKLLFALNGSDAIRIVKENDNIDLILMDIKMPLMDGLEATRLLRADGYKIPIIAQTAYAMSGDRMLAIESGCNDYLPKPIRRDALFKLIESFVLNKK